VIVFGRIPSHRVTILNHSSQTLHLFAQQTSPAEERRLGTNLMTVTRSILLFNLHPLRLSRNLSRTHFRSRLWPIYINKCAKKVVSWRQFTANSRQCLPEPWLDSRKKTKPAIKENIYTLPNLLTLSRIVSCPILGWSILDGNYYLSTGLLVYAGFTDWVGVICRP
jgi:hypothetical protein